MKKIKAIFFDGDGTLIDSYEEGIRAHKIVAEEMGLVFSEEKVKKYWGHAWIKFLEKMWPGIDAKEFERLFLKMGFNDIKLPLVPGMNEVLLQLKKKEYFLGLITNRMEDSLWYSYGLSGLELEKFDIIFGRKANSFSKPNPLVFMVPISLAFKNGICENEIIYVGDTLIDYEATQGTGMSFVGVLTGPLKRKDFIEAGVKKENIIKSVKQLPKFLKKL